MKPRRLEFIPIWNIPVFFEYAMRRVDCQNCGVRAERLPWASGKRTLTTVYMQFLARWAPKAFRARDGDLVSNDVGQVYQAVE